MFLLGTRSFCEVVIAGQWDRVVVDIDAIRAARDVCYGLFSVPFVIVMAFGVPKGPDDALKTAEIETQEEVRNLVVEKVDKATANGSRTAPDVLTLLQELKDELVTPHRMNAARSSQDEWIKERLDEARRKMKLRYVESLIVRYQNWEPIRRWNGAEPASEGTRANLAVPRTVRLVDGEEMADITRVPVLDEAIPYHERRY
jgi:hypothetical protein